MEEYKVVQYNGERSVPIYDLFRNIINYQTGFLYYLVDENNHRITNYYYGIEPLGIKSYYKVVYLFQTPLGIIHKYRIIKLAYNRDGEVLPLQEKFIIDDYCHEITSGNAKTLLLDCDGKYTFVEINPLSKYYKKKLYPLVFNEATAFNEEYTNFAKVRIEEQEGYIFRTDMPLINITKYNLLDEREVQYLDAILKKKELSAQRKLAYFTEDKDIPSVRRLVKTYEDGDNK